MNGRYTFYQTLIVVFTLAGLYMLWQLGEVLIVLLGAIIVASAVRPYVNRLEGAGVPRALAVLVVYLGVLGGVGLLLALSIPPLFAVIRELVEEGSLIRRLAATIWVWGTRLGYGEFGANLYDRLISEWNLLGGRLQQLAQAEGPSVLRSMVEVLGQLLLGLVVAFYWLTERDKFQGFLVSITPVRHRDRMSFLFKEVEQTLGAYIRGTGLLMLSIGVGSFVGLLLLGVPYALPLALLAGLLEAIPLVGATLGALPAVLVAFSVSPTLGVLTILLFVIIQFLENNILVPRIHYHSIGLNPLVVLIAVVAGASLNGIVGALLAIPIAGAAQVILQNLVVEPMVEDAKQSHEEHGIPVYDVFDDEDIDDTGADNILIARS